VKTWQERGKREKGVVDGKGPPLGEGQVAIGERGKPKAQGNAEREEVGCCGEQDVKRDAQMHLVWGFPPATQGREVCFSNSCVSVGVLGGGSERQAHNKQPRCALDWQQRGPKSVACPSVSPRKTHLSRGRACFCLRV
jgi:hypothetical protein